MGDDIGPILVQFFKNFEGLFMAVIEAKDALKQTNVQCYMTLTLSNTERNLGI